MLVFVGFPKYEAISPNVSNKPGAESTNALILSSTCFLLYESQVIDK